MNPRVRGLYAITPDEADSAVLLAKVRKAIAGGAALVQYRNKSAARERKLEQLRELSACCRAAGVALIVNDELDLALEAGADGLHLGREDGDLAQARRALGPGKLLGASCYDRIELARRAVAQGADHVAFGSVFGSPTKPGAVRAPLGIFSEARRELAVPLVAIGGITPGNAASVFAAGADAVAVISSLFDAADIEAAARKLSEAYKTP